MKYVRRLYYTCPSEAVSVLLEFFQLDAPEISENSDVHQADSLDVNHSSDVQIQNQISNGDMKTIITKVSEKEPRVLLGLLKSVIEMIEARNDLEHKGTALIFGCPNFGFLPSLQPYFLDLYHDLLHITILDWMASMFYFIVQT